MDDTKSDISDESCLEVEDDVEYIDEDLFDVIFFYDERMSISSLYE